MDTAVIKSSMAHYKKLAEANGGWGTPSIDEGNWNRWLNTRGNHVFNGR